VYTCALLLHQSPHDQSSKRKKDHVGLIWTILLKLVPIVESNEEKLEFIESLKASPPERAFVPDIRRALIISASNYDGTGMANLPGTEKDGEAVKEFLKKSLFKSDEVIHLHDPFKEEIEEEINNLEQISRGLAKSNQRGLFFRLLLWSWGD